MKKIITVRYPHYYKEFSCTGSRCEDTCCASWGVSIDPVSLKRYQCVKGEFGRRLRESIDTRTGSFIQRDGRCPFLNRENLCDMYTCLGEKSLCRTCRDFPRHMEDYGPLREVTLSLACPEAARLILGTGRRGEGECAGKTEAEGKTKAKGKTEAKDNTERLNNVKTAAPEYYIRRKAVEDKKGWKRADSGVDTHLLRQLIKVREAFYTILSWEGVEMEVRMAVILTLAHDAENRLENGRKDSLERLLARYTLPENRERLLSLFRLYKGGAGERQRDSLMCLYLELTDTLEPVSPRWKEMAGKYAEVLYGGNTGAVEHPAQNQELSRSELQKKLKQVYPFIDSDMEKLMRYFLYTYVLGAVYDGQLLTAVKTALFSCLVIREADLGILKETGSFTKEDQIETAHLWSRQLEHSDYNLKKMERLMRRHEALGMKQMMICLLAGDK
ncbi:flagellin lysine-N-methylase [uncultured Clostridium sp.]|uniref:flagellin lysine-N-methylase n=1 Tax=uncultured Clostridium sp. TaxID=59620 RepID=UPI0025DB5BA9|nr:flagellin lysine-N-methylase [uncultured Clostridium sp.]